MNATDLGSDIAVLDGVPSEPSPSSEVDLGYTVSVEAFSGPLDLLLYLVRRAEVDIVDIPLTTIADQFIATVRAWADLDLDVAGDFILLAATLLELKARSIAPAPLEPDAAPDDHDEELVDLHADLIRKLLIFRKYKDVVLALSERETAQTLRCARQLREDIPADPDEDAGCDLENCDPYQLAAAHELLMARINGLGPRTVPIDSLPLEVHIQRLVTLLRAAGHGSLADVLLLEASGTGKVTTLMAVLESARQRLVEAKQHEQFGPVALRYRDESERPITRIEFPPEAEDARKRKRRPPLMTFTAPPSATDDDEPEAATPEEPFETDEQRFLRELNDACALDTVLARVADLETSFARHLAELRGEPWPPVVPEPAPPATPIVASAAASVESTAVPMIEALPPPAVEAAAPSVSDVLSVAPSAVVALIASDARTDSEARTYSEAPVVTSPLIEAEPVAPDAPSDAAIQLLDEREAPLEMILIEPAAIAAEAAAPHVEVAPVDLAPALPPTLAPQESPAPADVSAPQETPITEALDAPCAPDVAAAELVPANVFAATAAVDESAAPTEHPPTPVAEPEPVSVVAAQVANDSDSEAEASADTDPDENADAEGAEAEARQPAFSAFALSTPPMLRAVIEETAESPEETKSSASTTDAALAPIPAVAEAALATDDDAPFDLNDDDAAALEERTVGTSILPVPPPRADTDLLEIDKLDQALDAALNDDDTALISLPVPPPRATSTDLVPAVAGETDAEVLAADRSSALTAPSTDDDARTRPAAPGVTQWLATLALVAGAGAVSWWAVRPSAMPLGLPPAAPLEQSAPATAEERDAAVAQATADARAAVNAVTAAHAAAAPTAVMMPQPDLLRYLAALAAGDWSMLWRERNHVLALAPVQLPPAIDAPVLAVDRPIATAAPLPAATANTVATAFTAEPFVVWFNQGWSRWPALAFTGSDAAVDIDGLPIAREYVFDDAQPFEQRELLSPSAWLVLWSWRELPTP